jgi:hypothetical protein
MDGCTRFFTSVFFKVQPHVGPDSLPKILFKLFLNSERYLNSKVVPRDLIKDCPGCPDLAVLSGLSYPYDLALLSWCERPLSYLTYLSCPISNVLSWLYCPSHSCSCCPVLLVLSCPEMAVLSVSQLVNFWLFVNAFRILWSQFEEWMLFKVNAFKFSRS